MFRAYLDDYNLITVIINKEVDMLTSFFLHTEEGDIVNTTSISSIDLGKFNKYELNFDGNLKLHLKNKVFQKQNSCILESGKIVRTQKFDEEFYYDGKDLGITYSKEKTMIKVWSPIAKGIELIYYKKENSKKKIDLKYIDRGVWQAEVLEDIVLFNYYLNVCLTDKYKKVLDPYAIAGGENSLFNTIIDKEKTFQIESEIKFSGNILDAIIYEAHVRDMTINTSNKNKGLFLGMLEEINPIDYICDLGFTHLQLLPINDYHGVDEITKAAYNWGYNPVQFSVLEGSYSSRPKDPLSRINEFKMVVDYAHKKNIGIVLDVVFNHVYDEITFPFNSLVPGYYYHYDAKGIKTENSLLDNDIATTRTMVKEFILQTVKFYLEFYKIDGLRMDLMGLHDIKIVSEIYKLSKTIRSKAIIYGEGWNMNSMVNENERANMINQNKMEVAHFNDYFREEFYKVLVSENYQQSVFSDIFLGTKTIFSSPTKSINYLTCHDGYTLYDKLTLKSIPGKQLLDKIKLAFAFIVLSQGIPFIQGGDEFLRTKKYISNSYNAGDLINGFNYDLMNESKGLRKYIKDLISLRKGNKVFKMESADEINQYVTLIDDYYYRLTNEDKVYYVYFKLRDYEEVKIFENPVKMIFDSYQETSKELKEIRITHIGVYVFKKE